jgi:hypothetical protein
MSTAASVSVFTCGSELDAMNPLYHVRFQTPYDTWLKQKLGYAQFSGCWTACMPRSATDISTTPTTLLPDMPGCGKCIKDLVESPQKTAARQGGGCSLCVDAVAPWAYQQHTTTLPTPEELQTFVKGTTYPDAYQVFQNLPTCERAEWTRAVCGGDTTSGKEYAIPLEAASTTPTSDASSSLSTGALAAIVVVVILVSIVAQAVVKRRRRRERKPISGSTHAAAEKNISKAIEFLTPWVNKFAHAPSLRVAYISESEPVLIVGPELLRDDLSAIVKNCKSLNPSEMEGIKQALRAIAGAIKDPSDASIIWDSITQLSQCHDTPSGTAYTPVDAGTHNLDEVVE